MDVDDVTLYYLKQAAPDDWAVEMHFLTEGSTQLTQAEWQEISEGQVCMATADWSKINLMISDFCSAPGIKCNYEIKQLLAQFFARFQFFESLKQASASR